MHLNWLEILITDIKPCELNVDSIYTPYLEDQVLLSKGINAWIFDVYAI